MVVTYARVPPPGPEPTMTYSYSSWASCVGLPAARPVSNSAERNFILDIKKRLAWDGKQLWWRRYSLSCLRAYWNLYILPSSTLVLGYQQSHSRDAMMLSRPMRAEITNSEDN